MSIIIYTPEENIPDEISLIAQLLDDGADFLYVRKPILDDFSLVDYIESIPEKYYSKIITTSLIITKEFDLAGYHFTRDILRKNTRYNEKVRAWLHEKNKICSVSAHDIDEIKSYSALYNHVIVSPVFPSISKENHAYNWNKNELIHTLVECNSNATLFAVGGIDEHTIAEAKRMGFLNFGLLGAIWKNTELAVDSFKKVKKIALL